jgi:hypothetical protein
LLRLLEDVARKLIQEEHPEWDVLPASDYIRDTEKRLGCTPDVYVHRDNHLGIVEIKSVQPHIFEQRWRNEEGGITPPMAATIQALLTKHLTGADFAYVAALRVSHGLELDMVEIPDSPKLIKRIEDAAPLFWERVKRKEPPPADFATDAELVIRMHAAKATPDKVIDLSADNELPEMADRYRELAAIAKAAEDERKIIKARLLDKLGDAEFVLRHGDVFATARLIKKDPYKVEPKPYRDVRFRSARSQEEAA